MKKLIITFVILLGCLLGNAQQIWTADVPSVSQSGYYNIEVSNPLVAIANYNLSNLRVVQHTTGDRQTIPYFVRSVSPIQEVNKFIEHDLVLNYAKDSINTFVIHNNEQKSLQQIYVVITNTDVQIESSIRGSNDQKSWFMVKKDSRVNKFINDGGNESVMAIEFPRGNYKYYEVVLNNHEVSPLNILKVGEIANKNIYGQFDQVSLGKIELTTSEHNTTAINFPRLKYPYAINGLKVLIKEDVKYLRKVTLKDSLSHNAVNFQLSSSGDNISYFNTYKLTHQSTITIYNDDNPPLNVIGVEAFALKRYICAYLEAGATYQLEVDEREQRVAKYDLSHFKDEIPNDIPIVSSYQVQSTTATVEVRKQMFLENPIVMWSIIICVGLFLFIMCAKMLLKMKSEK